jgi:extradiol dioxygenase family protein
VSKPLSPVLLQLNPPTVMFIVAAIVVVFTSKDNNQSVNNVQLANVMVSLIGVVFATGEWIRKGHERNARTHLVVVPITSVEQY